MPDKEKILETILTASVEDLADAILNGIVTLDELRDTGELAAPKRKLIKEIVDARKAEDDKEWNEANATENEYALRNYLSRYPSGNHVKEAEQKIREIERIREKHDEERRRILEKLKTNPNVYARFEINGFLSRGTVTKEDIENCGIPSGVLKLLNSVGTEFEAEDLGNVPDHIEEGLTEVYFWGTPGAGKTTTLAAILSAAESAGQLELLPASSNSYSGKLNNIFYDQFAILPGPTPVEKTQYLPLVLNTPRKASLLRRFWGKSEKTHEKAISLIELSGEIFECFRKVNSSEPLKERHQQAFNSLVSFLGSNNPKIHFFIISADGNKKDEKGFSISQYLSAATTYFDRTHIFRKKTDAIYILVTKSDLLYERGSNVSYEESVQLAKEHINNPTFKYASFITALKKYCGEYGINGGILEVEPFTLGNIFFKDICQFDNTSALKVIGILDKRVRESGPGFFDNLRK